MPLKKLMLVRWLADETVGVVPTSDAKIKKGETVEAGNTVSVKWGSKFYQAEILQISGKNVVCLLFFTTGLALSYLST